MKPRRMGILRTVMLLGCAAFVSLAFGAMATVGPVTVILPAGFSPAGSQTQGNMQVAAWTKGEGAAKTLLQISIYDFGSAAQGAPSEKELAEGAEKYLGDFLKGIERHRTDYSQSPIERVKLAGLPAARSTWKGQAGGIAAVGVMYCVIVNQRIVVSLHTQDAGSAPTPAMREAMKAIESVRVAP